MDLLNKIALGHPIISRDSIIPICRAMEAQANAKVKNNNNYENPFAEAKKEATSDTFNNCK